MSLVGVLIRATVTTLAPVILVLIVINDGLVSSFTIHNKNTCIRSQTAIVQSSVYRQPYQLNINDSLRLSDNKGERKRVQVHGNEHYTYLQMSKEEDFFSDLEEGALAGIDTEDVEFVNMNDGELTDEFLAEMQESSPSQIEIMKDVRMNECVNESIINLQLCLFYS